MPGLEHFITVKTYQSIERDLSCDMRSTLEKLRRYWVCVYDECHYFYSDATFNTYTEFSFDALRYMMEGKIQIFISATMKNVKPLILERKPQNVTIVQLENSNYGNQQNALMIVRDVEYTMSQSPCIEFSAEPDYSYLSIHCFDFIEDLVDEIVEGVLHDENKWLIFCYSIAEGKRLVNAIKEKITATDKKSRQIDEVIFIDAR